MFITQEILNKYHACNAGKKIMQKLYPDGAEVMELLDDKRLPVEMFHWGMRYLPVTTEEELKYYKVCEIEDSEEVCDSTDVKRSKYIDSSKEVHDSLRINSSKVVYDSENVSSSDEVYASQYVVSSSNINLSDHVYASDKIAMSNRVAHSKNIGESNDIARCEEISHGRGLYRCNNVENSAFSSFLSYSSDCFFCTDLQYSRYMVFNKPATQEVIEEIRTKLKEFSTERLNLLQFNKDYLFTTDARFCENFGEYYLTISDDFWNWVKTLPNFDPFIMYRITYMPMWLEE